MSAVRFFTSGVETPTKVRGAVEATGPLEPGRVEVEERLRAENEGRVSALVQRECIFEVRTDAPARTA